MIALIFLFYACKEQVAETLPKTTIYSSEDGCKMAVANSAKRIDSLIMLRCATTDSVVWKRYEDSVAAEVKRITADVGQSNMYKYLNTHPYRRIPCMIGDSVWLFYKQ